VSEGDYDPEAYNKAECERLLGEAMAARWEGLEVPSHSSGAASPELVAEAVTEVRGRLDTLERLRVQLIGLRWGGRTGAREARAARQEKWDARAEEEARMGRRPEFEIRGQTEARYNLSVLQEERHARMVARVSDLISATDEQISAMYFGLRDTQQELLTRLRYLEWENFMERT
jgi:hypothetical protein